jgi:hypothetical protein
MEWLRSTKLLTTVLGMTYIFIGNLVGAISGEFAVGGLVGISGTFVTGKIFQYKNGHKEAGE